MTKTKFHYNINCLGNKITVYLTVLIFVCSFNSEGSDIIVSGVYAECSEAAAREAAYKLYLAPDSMQDRLLTTTLDARRELANACGFHCYADRYRILKSLYSLVILYYYKCL